MKLITAGSSIDGIAVVVALAIWQSHPRGGFLQAPGWITIGAFVLGVIMTIAGLWMRESKRYARHDADRGRPFGPIPGRRRYADRQRRPGEPLAAAFADHDQPDPTVLITSGDRS